MSMDAEFFIEIVRQCKKQGLSKEDAEDIAQEVIVSWLSYANRHNQPTSQTICQAIVDAKRKLYGRGEKPEFQDFTGDEEASGDCKEIDLEKFTNTLCERDALCFKLSREDGWSQRTIARFLELKPARISQILRDVKASLKRFLEEGP